MIRVTTRVRMRAAIGMIRVTTRVRRRVRVRVRVRVDETVLR